MPKPALTRAEAAARAALLTVADYDVTVDLTGSATTFGSTTKVRFQARQAGRQTWIDLVGQQIESATLNGIPLDLSGYDGQRLPLPNLAAENELVVAATCAYSRTGEGLHRLVDPVDAEAYVYSQFETADAQRAYACFDQPDLKASFTLHVSAPAHWKVISNSPTPAPQPISTGTARWDFAPTPRIATYITALIGGPFEVSRDEYAGALGSYPLALFSRATMARFLDADRIFAEVKAGFKFFEERFGQPYPFAKYDQIFVPEFNAGAMENAGAVTIMEDYVFRSRVTEAAYEQRANTLLHELAHMWFGNLVTMTWWNDLWLNESFAEWAAHHALAAATQYDSAWTTFLNTRKTWAYRQDQLPSTHPIATDSADLEEVKLNFDGITYAKGASALRQLVAWVGEEEFFAGLRAYFQKHKWGNTTLADLLRELAATSGRDLGDWSRDWLRTAGVNLLRPIVEVAADGTFAHVTIAQEPPATPAGLPAILRGHRLRLGVYALQEGRLERIDQVELDVVGETTEVPQLLGRPAGDLLLLNDDDLTFAKVRLDERSLATARANMGAFSSPLPRTLIWGAAWDMARDAEIATGEYLQLARSGLPAETDIGVVAQVLRQAKSAIEFYAAREHIPGYRARFAQLAHDATLTAAAGSDHQLTYVRALCGCASTPEQLGLLRGLLAGSRALPGLRVDADLRWTLLSRLVSTGWAGEPEISAELERDRTATGQRHAAAARAAVPTPAAKQSAWESVLTDDSLPNALIEAKLSGLGIAEQSHLLRPFRARYFAVVDQMWARNSSEMGRLLATGLFPGLLIEQETVAAATEFLGRSDLPEGLRRVVTEGRDSVQRALRCRDLDAQFDPATGDLSAL